MIFMPSKYCGAVKGGDTITIRKHEHLTSIERDDPIMCTLPGEHEGPHSFDLNLGEMGCERARGFHETTIEATKAYIIGVDLADGPEYSVTERAADNRSIAHIMTWFMENTKAVMYSHTHRSFKHGDEVRTDCKQVITYPQQMEWGDIGQNCVELAQFLKYSCIKDKWDEVILVNFILQPPEPSDP